MLTSTQDREPLLTRLPMQLWLAIALLICAASYPKLSTSESGFDSSILTETASQLSQQASSEDQDQGDSPGALPSWSVTGFRGTLPSAGYSTASFPTPPLFSLHLSRPPSDSLTTESGRHHAVYKNRKLLK